MPIHTFIDTDCNANKVFNGEAQIAVCINQASLECMCTVGDEGVLMPHMLVLQVTKTGECLSRRN